MTDAPIHAVTGAYGYSGKYIAQRLLDEGHTVITLTNSLSRRQSFWRPHQGISIPFRSTGPTDRAATGRVCPLQHVLGAVQSSPLQAR